MGVSRSADEKRIGKFNLGLLRAGVLQKCLILLERVVELSIVEAEDNTASVRRIIRDAGLQSSNRFDASLFGNRLEELIARRNDIRPIAQRKKTVVLGTCLGFCRESNRTDFSVSGLWV
ncbi:hypothetical protein GBM96_11520 [Sutterella seckii]|uniref:Uncharacterized protein n=1 Tax=Sutterella seckii TaxID=1944635 RepID=A0AAI9SAS4_9BURK|nr:hypothetical protein [Sutterella seckii]KAB7649350.1 hypothetical protein GBM96_11520 [Sutterella seckii]